MNDERIGDALRGIADGGPLPDEAEAWAAVRRRAAERRRRRLVASVGGSVVAAAAVVIAVVVGAGGDRGPDTQDVAVGPGATQTQGTAPSAAGEVPEHPLVAVSTDGRRLTLHDGETGALIRTLAEMERWEIEAPRLSADGRVLYVVREAGGPRIGGVHLDGTASGAHPFIEGPGTSPTEHGGLVAYVRNGGDGIRFVDATGALVRELVWRGGAPRIDSIELSPDGSRLLVLAEGGIRVVATDVGSLDEAPILAEGLTWATWRDGATLLAVSAGEVVTVDVATGEQQTFGPIPFTVEQVAVGDAVYAVDGGQRVWRDDVELGIRAREIAVPPPVADTSPPPTPDPPLLVAAGMRGLLEVDPATGEVLRTVAAAGEGRPTIAEAYRITSVTRAGDEVWFTEEAGPEDRPSIWRLDPVSGERRLVIEDAGQATISPDGTRLAYVPAPPEGLPHDAPQIVVRDLATGEERGILGYPDGFSSVVTRIDWSPDSSRLLHVDGYENAVAGILDPSTAGTLADAVQFDTDGTVAAVAWFDDRSVVVQVRCCYADPEAQPPRLVLFDATTGTEVRELLERPNPLLRQLAVAPSGRILGVTADFELVELRPDGTLTRLAEGVHAVEPS